MKNNVRQNRLFSTVGVLCLVYGLNPAWGQTPAITYPLLPAPSADVVGKRPVLLSEIDLVKAATPSPIQIENDDVLKLAVLGYPELTHVGRVQRDGRVTFPLVGDLAATGRTLVDIRDDIQGRLVALSQRKRATVEPEDALKFLVWRHPDLTHIAPVTLGGVVTFPLVGDINVLGRSIDEIRDEARAKLEPFLREPRVSILIERQMLRGLVTNPKVSLMPEKMRDRTVAVLGEVFVQGVQTITERTRVLDVISTAKQNALSASLNDVVLIRNANGVAPEFKKLRLADYLEGKAPDQNIYVQADDVIFVSKSKISAVGDFIDRFFVRTKPVFDWWLGVNQARYAEEYSRGLAQIYRNLNAIPNP